MAINSKMKGRIALRYVWKARVLPGKLEEYKKRHDDDCRTAYSKP